MNGNRIALYFVLVALLSLGSYGLFAWLSHDTVHRSELPRVVKELSLAGEPGPIGLTGAPGVDGLNGLNCWDLNGNGTFDVEEDFDGNGEPSAMDCRGLKGDSGAPGPRGERGPKGEPGICPDCPTAVVPVPTPEPVPPAPVVVTPAPAPVPTRVIVNRAITINGRNTSGTVEAPITISGDGVQVNAPITTESAKIRVVAPVVTH